MVDTSRPLALVTGAQQGIGSAIGAALANAGYDVAVADLKDDHSGASLASDWGVSVQVEAFVCDVSNEAQVDGLFVAIVASFGRAPTLLVNNAAMQVWASMLDLTLEQWERTIKVNLTGMFLMTQRFARLHKARNNGEPASIVNLGSGCNQLAFPKLVSYTASKGGVEMLTKVSALELGEIGIRVNCVSPGSIETERTQAETDDYAESWSKLTPLRRVGKVDDVADAIVALADDKMRFVSGQTINVDGGLFSRAAWPAHY